MYQLPPWRNWLARSAVNRKVGGSSPPGGAIFTSSLFLLGKGRQNREREKKKSNLAGFEPAISGFVVQRVIRCATGPSAEPLTLPPHLAFAVIGFSASRWLLIGNFNVSRYSHHTQRMFSFGNTRWHSLSLSSMLSSKLLPCLQHKNSFIFSSEGECNFPSNVQVS